MTTPEDQLTDFADRVVVVTGGSRGLGRAMVEAFARCGADVVIASRKLDACEALASEVSAATGRRALPVACHVGDWEQCDALTEAVYDTFGRCDVLVNNAGSSPLYPSLAEVSEALFDKTLAVNLRGTFRLSATIGERMVTAGGGSIINVSSVSASAPSRSPLCLVLVVPFPAVTWGSARWWASRGWRFRSPCSLLRSNGSTHQ